MYDEAGAPARSPLPDGRNETMFTDLIRRYGKQELYEQYTRCVDEKIKEKIQWIADGSSVLAAYILLTRDSSCLSYTAVTISNRSTRKKFFFSLQLFSPFFYLASSKGSKLPIYKLPGATR